VQIHVWDHHILTHHVVTVVNAQEQPVEGLRLAFDNQDFSRDAPSIAAGGTYVFDFERSAETGYVFSVLHGGRRVEIGRCGYTETGTNRYRVTLGESSLRAGFQCEDVTGQGERWR
jgi:hypothetical protein